MSCAFAAAEPCFEIGAHSVHFGSGTLAATLSKAFTSPGKSLEARAAPMFAFIQVFIGLSSACTTRTAPSTNVADTTMTRASENFFRILDLDDPRCDAKSKNESEAQSLDGIRAEAFTWET